MERLREVLSRKGFQRLDHGPTSKSERSFVNASDLNHLAPIGAVHHQQQRMLARSLRAAGIRGQGQNSTPCLLTIQFSQKQEFKTHLVNQ